MSCDRCLLVRPSIASGANTATLYQVAPEPHEGGEGDASSAAAAPRKTAFDFIAGNLPQGCDVVSPFGASESDPHTAVAAAREDGGHTTVVTVHGQLPPLPGSN